MRTIIFILTLFSAWQLAAQPRQQSYGRELPRSAVRAYPTAEAASAASAADDRYFSHIETWSRTGAAFTAPFTVPFAWANRQVLFHLESASADYEVCVNGRTVAYNGDGSTPAEYNLTKFVQEGRNTIEIRLAAETSAIECWRSGGTPQIGAAWVMSQPTMYIRDVLVVTRPADERTANAEVGIVVKTASLNPRTSRVYYDLIAPSGEVAAAGQHDLTLDMRREDTLRFLARIPVEGLWSAERPTRYRLRLRTQFEGRFGEYMEYPIGFRTLALREGRLEVNGAPVRLRSREAAPTAAAEELVRLRDEGCNTLQLQPGPVDPALYDLCDSIGLYVIAQAPIDSSRSGDSRRKGGNPSNDPAWQPCYIERIGNGFHTAKRHPSVIAYSLARRSANGICLYEGYLALKRTGTELPLIYPEAAGEWNNDPIGLE